jgi:hypothetical protein
MANPEPIFLNLSADDPDLGTTEIESMCMNCHKNVSKFIFNLEFSRFYTCDVYVLGNN